MKHRFRPRLTSRPVPWQWKRAAELLQLALRSSTGLPITITINAWPCKPRPPLDQRELEERLMTQDAGQFETFYLGRFIP